jgi:hypothetical protein
MADTKTTDKPNLGDVTAAGVLELARTGRLTDATAAALSDAVDPKPEPTEADRQADRDAAELAELRAARDAGKTSSTKGTDK